VSAGEVTVVVRVSAASGWLEVRLDSSVSTWDNSSESFMSSPSDCLSSLIFFSGAGLVVGVVVRLGVELYGEAFSNLFSSSILFCLSSSCCRCLRAALPSGKLSRYH
jgi:hypothetical protein